MIININFEDILERAEQRARHMVKDGLYSRFKQPLNYRIEKAKLGCMGELAFEEYLKQGKIPYELDSTDFSKSNSDEYDFLIGVKRIDIKVAKKSTSRSPTDAWTYGYPEEQHPLSKDFVIIGWVDFNNSEIGFYGWITGEKISQFPVVTENSFARYKYLTPNHEFRWGALNKDIESLIKSII